MIAKSRTAIVADAVQDGDNSGVGEKGIQERKARFREWHGAAQGQLATTPAELVRLPHDFDGRRETLDRVSLALLHRLALGGQMIARLCATDEDAPELEPLTELLG